ncbi:RDD family protein [Mucilaginibacter rigui]|uniref:RDD family protein n=1 Tax=Mucilaginibacter rigui TaxID=534635 RepID=A0ABR7X606_9SPHI|nr:RDD family protein [Mucilaginibacter rigui]MBD1386007.1 RDD family protein [Mucilaginibacter rigui]
MTDGYYISINDEEKGPFTLEEVLEMAPGLDTMVLSPKAEDWERAADLPEFFYYFEAQGIYFPTEDNLASFWVRLLAYFIDYILTSIVFSFFVPPIILAIYKRLLNNTYTMGDLNTYSLFLLLTFIIVVFYNTFFEASKMQGSIGKRMCGIVVVDADGRRLSFMKAFFRNLGKFVSGTVLGIGYLAILWDDHRQAWHDKFAKTYVLTRNRQ